MVWVAGGVSVAVLVAGMIVVPRMLVKLPRDYFVRDQDSAETNKHTPALTALKVAKNILGIMLIAAGIAMLLLPGQGILTAVVGVFLLDFPGKHRLQRWLGAQPWVFKPINWYRRKKGVEPLQHPRDQDDTTDTAAPQGA